MAETYRGYTIRKSGKTLWRVLDARGHALQPRVHSIEAARALIVAQGRVMTRQEHALVHNHPVAADATEAQAASERAVMAGECEGYLTHSQCLMANSGLTPASA